MLAIGLAVVLVGTAAWFRFAPRHGEVAAVGTHAGSEDDKLAKVRPVQPGDHVRGNPKAPLVFVVYSDFQCPFCKDFHSTMSHLMDIYGHDGKVAWVFRHMPVAQMHPQAPMYALASECVAAEGGASAFWTFADALFAAMAPDAPVSAPDLVSLAERAGASREAFTACMRSNTYLDHIQADFDEAVAAGGEGTPLTIILSPNQRLTFEGAQTFAALAAAVQSVLPLIGATQLNTPGPESAGDLFGKELEEATVPEQAMGTSTDVGQ